jgi:hypothetical protein
MALHDNEAKARLGYKDKRSKVYPDGREVLYGKDWAKRKQELWERCGGKCEWIVDNDEPFTRAFRCRSEAHDPHHTIPRSRGRRDDRLENLIALCRLHHDILDWKKLKWRKNAEQSQPRPSLPL